MMYLKIDKKAVVDPLRKSRESIATTVVYLCCVISFFVMIIWFSVQVSLFYLVGSNENAGVKHMNVFFCIYITFQEKKIINY